MASSGKWEARMGIVLDTSGISSEIQKVQKVVSQKSIAIKVGSETGTKQLTTFKNALGGVTKEVKTFNSAGEEMASGIKSYSTKAQEATKVNNNLGQSFLDVTLKVAKFYASTLIIKAFTATVSEASQIIKEFDDAITDFKKVSDLSGDSLDNYTQKLGELGEEVARTRIEMTEASAEFKKSGFTDEDSAQLARIASEYQNVADSELSAGDSASFIISQMKAFNVTATDAESIIDKVNEVSNRFSVSSTDISSALTKTSASLATYGNTMDETIGLISAGTEVMTGQAGKVGRGLRSIGANIVKLAKDTGTLQYKINGATKTISLFDETTGEMKNTYTVLSEISENWDKMSTAEQSALAISLAGKTQIDVFTSTLSNFDSAISATSTSMDSMGSASEENAKYMESLEAKINAMKSAFQELVLGEGGLSTFIKGLVDIGTAILKFANSDVGGTIIKITALIGVMALLNKGFIALKNTSLISNIAFATTELTIGGMSGSMATLTAIVNVLTESIMANPLLWGGIAIAGIIGAVALASDVLTTSFEENKEKLSDLQSEYEKSNSELKSTTSELENINKQIDEINSKDKLSLTDKKNLESLRLTREELEQQLILQKSINEENQKAYEEQAKKTVRDKVTSPYITEEKTFSFGDVKVQKEADRVEQLKAISSEMEKQQEIIDRLSAKKEKNNNLTKEEQTQLTDASIAYKEAREQGNEYAQQLQEETKDLGENSETRKYAYEGIGSFTDQIKETTSATSESTGYTNNNTEAVEENSNTVNTASEINKEYKKSMDGIDKTIDSIQSAYGTLNGAVEEYNKNGGFSMDTVQSLLDLSPSYLKMLDFENGKVTLNSKALEKKTQAQVKQMKQTIRNTAISKLNALAEQTSETATYDNGAIHINSASDWKQYREQVTATTKALTVNQAVENAESKGVDKKKINKVISDMKKQISIVDNLTSGVKSLDNASTKNTKSTKNNTKATNSNTVAKSKAQKQAEKLVKTQEKLIERLNDEKDVLNEQKSNYEKVFDYIKSEIEDQIEKYENLRDTKDNLIDEELDLEEERHEGVLSNLEEEKESLEDYWDAQIDEYEKANDELEEQIELQKLQEALGEAKSTKVKVLGESGKFEYREDEEAVSKAQYDIDEYNRKKAYEEKLQALKDEKEKEISIIESSIEKENILYEERKSILEKEKEENDEYYNNKIEKLKSYESEISSYETLIDDMESKSLAKKLLGTDLENQNWNKRIANLTKFVNNYNEILASLSSVESATSTAESKKEKAQEIVDKEEAKAKAKKSSSKKKSTTKKKKTTAKKHASGIISVPDDEVAIVGENPNYQELSIGSKLNSDSGIVTSLNRGTGIIPHNLTSTLVDMARMYQGGNEATPIANTNSKQANYTIQNMTVQADNADEFVKSITTKFKNMAIQTAY